MGKKRHDKNDSVRLVHLDYTECVRFFNETESWEREYDIYFEGHPKLNVYYEDVVQDSNREIRKVFNFLDVPFMMTMSNMKKQRMKCLSDAISNYSNLKKRFVGTRWVFFFNDFDEEFKCEYINT